jgi:hypothetical protein
VKKRTLYLDKLRLDGDTQPRAGINAALVSEYAKLYEDGVELPPVVVFFDGVDYWLADGFHRWHARFKAGIEGISCEIHNGTVEDARWWSWTVHQAHWQRPRRLQPEEPPKPKAPKGAKELETKHLRRKRVSTECTSSADLNKARADRDKARVDFDLAYTVREKARVDFDLAYADLKEACADFERARADQNQARANVKKLTI